MDLLSSDGSGEAAGSRNQWIEAGRVVAAISIVWFHSGRTGNQVAYLGLAYFLSVSSFLEYSSIGRRGPKLIRDAARRYITPWAFWFVLFMTINIVRQKPLLQPAHTVIEQILFGSYPHLWYLPFGFVCISAIRLIAQAGLKRYLPVGALLGSLVILAFTSVWRPWSLALGAPVAQYAEAALPVLFGLILVPAQYDRRWMTAAGLVLVCCAALALLPFEGVGLPYLLGCGLAAFCAALGKVPLHSKALAQISPLMFGVYLVHPLFLGLARFHRLPAAAVVLTIFLVSTTFVGVARRFGGKRAEAIT